MNKFGAKKVTVDGITFDSQKEARRYWELKLLERAGEIRHLERQVEYELIPTQRDEKGRVRERACTYVCDFRYALQSGETVVEDVKGYRDPQSAAYAKFVIKRKLMLYKYGISVREI